MNSVWQSQNKRILEIQEPCINRLIFLTRTVDLAERQSTY